MVINVSQTEAYIRQAARARGIDPDIAVRVARSEGLAPGVWQSNVRKGGAREPSYGPFQLLVGGQGTGFPAGMGNDFIRQTGLDPRDPSTVNAQIDFALDNAARKGWGAWYGARNVGIGNRDGIGGARPIGVSPAVAQSSVDLPDTAPIPTAYAPQQANAGGGFDPFSLILPSANAAPAPQMEEPTLNAPVSEPSGLLAAAPEATPPYVVGGQPTGPVDQSAEARALEEYLNGLEGAGAPDPGRALYDPIDAVPQPAGPTGDTSAFDTLSIMSNPSLSAGANLPFADQTPLPSLPMEDLTFWGNNGTLNPAAPVITGDGIDTFTARPMPNQMGTPPQVGGPVGVGQVGPDGNLVLPQTAPTPTPNPNATPSTPKWANALLALGGLMAAFDQGSPELKAVSLPGYAHKPTNTSVPMPRGLL